MATVVPTIENFLLWYNKYKTNQCSKDYARQMVGFHTTRWYYLCRDYEKGEDITRYFWKKRGWQNP